MQKKKITPLTRFARSAASGEAQPYLPLRSLRSLGLRARILSRFAPSGFALALLGRFAPLGFALTTYPMTMPSFMPIGPKLWALEGYIQTDSPSYII